MHFNAFTNPLYTETFGAGARDSSPECLGRMDGRIAALDHDVAAAETELAGRRSRDHAHDEEAAEASEATAGAEAEAPEKDES